MRYQRVSRFLTGLSIYPSLRQYNLTISEEKKFVWFRVAKVGTRSIFHALHKAGVELSAEHPFLCHYPVHRYRDFFKFAFVRNPWDRLVSCWADKVVDHNRLHFSDDSLEEMQSFERFVDYVAENVDLEHGNPHLRLQCRLIDLNHIDFLGRFENFMEDITKVMDFLGIETKISRKNASSRKQNYREYYSEDTIQKAAKLYSRDIQIFNYDF